MFYLNLDLNKNFKTDKAALVFKALAFKNTKPLFRLTRQERVLLIFSSSFFNGI